MSSIDGGINLNEFFETGMDRISEQGKQLQADMEAMLNSEEVDPADTLLIQYEMGQYNAILEAVSTLTKSVTDSLKSLAQRAG